LRVRGGKQQQLRQYNNDSDVRRVTSQCAKKSSKKVQKKPPQKSAKNVREMAGQLQGIISTLL
jgi:hypothetical protein